MNVLSLFDGMSCGQIALNKIGMPIDNYFASEIDKYATKVTNHNYPNTIHIGNVTQVNATQLPQIDLLIGGSPCQGFSFSGKQLNFQDPHSALFFEYVRLLEETKPKYFLLENVMMKKEYQDVITECLGIQPIKINSALVSAQTRKRLYWTNIPNVTQPEDRGIVWGDVREHGVNNERYYYTEAAMQWLGRTSRKLHKPLTIHQNNDKMQMLEASHLKKYSNQRFFGILDLPSDEHTLLRMRDEYSINGKGQELEFRYDDKTHTLTTVDSDGVVVPFSLPVDDYFLRYITPLECERLQNVPDNYTNSVSNSQRYKMLGNGWTVDVIAHILKEIL